MFISWVWVKKSVAIIRIMSSTDVKVLAWVKVLMPEAGRNPPSSCPDKANHERMKTNSNEGKVNICKK